jgi:pimeloyl-ACP methyl ester carboxylesterase
MIAQRSKIVVVIILSILSCLAIRGARADVAGAIVDAPSRFASLDGLRVHYKSYGKGREALVFVHGWTCNMSFWRGQVPAFESKTRVIVIDLPGHGESDKPHVDYTMDLFARSIDAVLRDAGVERAVLVGHSMGTPVIRQFYRKYPGKTLALVIVDGPLRPFGDAATMAKFLEPLRGPNYNEAAGRFLDGMLAPVSSPSLRQEIRSAMLGIPQYVAVSAMDGMASGAIWTEDKINVPALAVMTKRWPPDNEQFDRSIAPQLDYQSWDGVSHFLMMEKPREFNEALAAFLTKNGLLKK